MAKVLKQLNERVLRRVLVDGHIKRIQLLSQLSVAVAEGTWTLQLLWG